MNTTEQTTTSRWSFIHTSFEKTPTWPRTIYRIHGCSYGKVVEDHGTDDLADIIRLEREWKNDPEITSISIYKNAELVKEWRN